MVRSFYLRDDSVALRTGAVNAAVCVGTICVSQSRAKLPFLGGNISHVSSGTLWPGKQLEVCSLSGNGSAMMPAVVKVIACSTVKEF